MKIFLSWSGRRSQAVAQAFRDWLPDLISFFDPWLSARDIDKGTRWQEDLTSALRETHLGIVCVTLENRLEPWLLYEAGALSNAVRSERVCTYLIDLTPVELVGPLVQFQATRATRDDTFTLVRTLNGSLGPNARSDSQLERIYARWWPELEKRLHSLPPLDEVTTPRRSDREVLEELLLLTRRRGKMDDVAMKAVSDYFARVDDLFGGEGITALENSAPLSGGPDDPNAQSWFVAPTKTPVDTTLSGVWGSRWNASIAPRRWQKGIASLAMHDKYFVILHRDQRGECVVLGIRDHQILRGREYNIRSRTDSGPYIGRIVSANRIDGAWSHGRWDFRR